MSGMNVALMNANIGVRTGLAVEMKRRENQKRMQKFHSLLSDRLQGGIRNTKTNKLKREVKVIEAIEKKPEALSFAAKMGKLRLETSLVNKVSSQIKAKKEDFLTYNIAGSYLIKKTEDIGK